MPTEAERRAAFVQQMAPVAQKWAEASGIPVAVLIAIMGSESNFGAAPSLFGIKGSGTGGTASLATQEVVGGKRVNQSDNFAVNKTPDDAFNQFLSLISSGRYKSAWSEFDKSGDWQGLLKGITDAGYATDKTWPSLISGIARDIAPQIGATPNPARGGPPMPDPTKDLDAIAQEVTGNSKATWASLTGSDLIAGNAIAKKLGIDTTPTVKADSTSVHYDANGKAFVFAADGSLKPVPGLDQAPKTTKPNDTAIKVNATTGKAYVVDSVTSKIIEPAPQFDEAPKGSNTKGTASVTTQQLLSRGPVRPGAGELVAPQGGYAANSQPLTGDVKLGREINGSGYADLPAFMVLLDGKPVSDVPMTEQQAKAYITSMSGKNPGAYSIAVDRGRYPQGGTPGPNSYSPFLPNETIAQANSDPSKYGTTGSVLGAIPRYMMGGAGGRVGQELGPEGLPIIAGGLKGDSGSLTPVPGTTAGYWNQNPQFTGTLGGQAEKGGGTSVGFGFNPFSILAGLGYDPMHLPAGLTPTMAAIEAMRIHGNALGGAAGSQAAMLAAANSPLGSGVPGVHYKAGGDPVDQTIDFRKGPGIVGQSAAQGALGPYDFGSGYYGVGPSGLYPTVGQSITHANNPSVVTLSHTSNPSFPGLPGPHTTPWSFANNSDLVNSPYKPLAGGSGDTSWLDPNWTSQGWDEQGWSAAGGANFYAAEPTQLTVGDSPYGPEKVTVQPMGAPKVDSGTLPAPMGMQSGMPPAPGPDTSAYGGGGAYGGWTSPVSMSMGPRGGYPDAQRGDLIASGQVPYEQPGMGGQTQMLQQFVQMLLQGPQMRQKRPRAAVSPGAGAGYSGAPSPYAVGGRNLLVG